MNTAQLAALLGSFVFGMLFTIVSAWPRRGPLTQLQRPAEPAVSWPSLLDAESRLGIALDLAGRRDPSTAAALQRAREEERDPRIRAAVEHALGPIIGEPE